MCCKRLLKNVPLMLFIAAFALVIATLAGMRLRYAHIFKPMFAPTCIAIPDGEVVPTISIFLLAAGTTAAALTNALMRSARLRRAAIGLLIGLLAFGAGLLAYSAI